MHPFLLHINEYLLPCFYKQQFGVDCPGCGLQRAFVELLQGNFTESLMLYPALFPLLGMFSFLLLHITFKFKQGAKVLTWLFISNAAIIFIHYIFKLLFYGIH